MSDLTAEELEQGRRSLLSQLRQSLRKADLSEYPVDADTMRDLVVVLEGLAPKSADEVNYEELDLNTYSPDMRECVNGHQFKAEADCVLPEGWDYFFCRRCVEDLTGKVVRS